METLIENMLIVAAVVFLAGMACIAFIASPYEIHFEDVDGIEEL
ncbi:MAG TPA: hypothetical protein PK289_03910 [Bacteroidia bacterium]|jgi:hypothetical protein|nr:hypothetical protein [Bacteroidia bacterium]HRG54245.1 hypothetical protein [Bacteroidia bacterium]